MRKRLVFIAFLLNACVCLSGLLASISYPFYFTDDAVIVRECALILIFPHCELHVLVTFSYLFTICQLHSHALYFILSRSFSLCATFLQTLLLNIYTHINITLIVCNVNMFLLSVVKITVKCFSISLTYV